MEKDYKVELALEILQSKMANLINSKQNSYMNFKNDLEVIKKKQNQVYKLNEEVIDEIINTYQKERGK